MRIVCPGDGQDTSTFECLNRARLGQDRVGERIEVAFIMVRQGPTTIDHADNIVRRAIELGANVIALADEQFRSQAYTLEPMPYELAYEVHQILDASGRGSKQENGIQVWIRLDDQGGPQSGFYESFPRVEGEPAIANHIYLDTLVAQA